MPNQSDGSDVTSKNFFLLVVTKLPVEAFYNILECMVPSIEIGPALARSIAPVCRLTWTFVQSSDDVWERVKVGYSKMWDADVNSYSLRSYRPSSQEESHMNYVMKVHQLIRRDTADALVELEKAIENEKQPLTLTVLKGIFRRHSSNGSYYIDANQSIENGNFLTFCCEAVFASERVVKGCVKYLIQVRGACPNKPTSNGYTPLAIATARGLPTVVQYLLEQGADINQRSQGWFKLESSPKKTVKGCFSPSRFAQELKSKEIAHGAQRSDQVILYLDRCIDILNRARKRERKNQTAPKSGDVSTLEACLSALTIR